MILFKASLALFTASSLVSSLCDPDAELGIEDCRWYFMMSPPFHMSRILWEFNKTRKTWNGYKVAIQYSGGVLTETLCSE